MEILLVLLIVLVVLLRFGWAIAKVAWRLAIPIGVALIALFVTYGYASEPESFEQVLSTGMFHATVHVRCGGDKALLEAAMNTWDAISIESDLDQTKLNSLTKEASAAGNTYKVSLGTCRIAREHLLGLANPVDPLP